MNLNISIIIPVYNAERFLEKAVESALQFDEVKEILLIEDASPDNSLKICEKLANENPKIKLLQHHDKANHGAGATRNLGLEKASQEFIAFLDADDEFLPNRFDAERELFENPKIEGVFGAIGTNFLTEKGKQEFQEKFKNVQLTTVNFSAEGKEVFEGLMRISKRDFGVFFSLIALTVRKSSIDKNRLRFNEKLRVHQDTDFIVKLSYHCHLKTGIIDKAVSLRGVHDDNRITKIKPNSGKLYQNMALLYESRYEWIRNIAEIDDTVKKEIELRKITFSIAKEKRLKKIYSYFWQVLKNPQLLKTRYRFHILKR